MLGGAISYYGLSDWWLSCFTDDERSIVASEYAPGDLTEGSYTHMGGSAAQYLSIVAGWFKSEKDRTIGYKFIEKAEELAPRATMLDRHFVYQAKKEIYYRFRDLDGFAMGRAIEACEQQIAISAEAATAFHREYENQLLPAHEGYKSLAIIREKEGRLDEAIRLCEAAQAEGWSGDWSDRVNRYKLKLAKSIRA